MKNTKLISYKDGIIGVIKMMKMSDSVLIDEAILIEIEQAFLQWEHHDGVKVIVFTSDEEDFLPDLELNQIQFNFMKTLSKLCERIENSSKVTISVINGKTTGIGFEIAIACDIRIATEHATIGFSEANFAFFPATGGVQRLVRLIGASRALNMILTGELISSLAAKEFGLISNVVPYEELWTTVLKIASSLMTKRSFEIRMAKLAINQGYETHPKTALMMEKLSRLILTSSKSEREEMIDFLRENNQNHV